MRKPLRTILVEDEPYVRRDLADMLQKTAQVELVGEAGTAKEAIQMINTNKPDLVLLDLNLADIDGYRVLDSIETAPAVVAVTAFPQHAATAFAKNLADYILKPVEENRLRTALLRARDQIFLRSIRDNTGVSLEINGQTSQIPLANLFWVRSSENYVEVCTTEGKGLIRSTFQSFRDKLPPGYTLEISRGHIVARHQIKSWKRNPKGHLEIILKCGAVFLVSKRLQKDVQQQLELLF
ncbi:MAG: DNA-binding response regulator [Verrucomicrobia bacterium]|nr:DNA-binding response regulator [Verrucomicrobiota bacterium]